MSFITAYRQQKLIVYNVPKHQAIDIIHGRQYAFIGDSILWYDDLLRNFHLQPSRILHRIVPDSSAIAAHEFQINNKHIALIDTTVYFSDTIPKQNIDVLILSKNPKLYIMALHNRFSIGQIVIDGSVPAWKARLWQRDCDSLHIPCYDVSEKGAFVMNLE